MNLITHALLRPYREAETLEPTATLLYYDEEPAQAKICNGIRR